MNERLLLIDGHSMAFRAFYALRGDNFSTTSGQYTNAVYGFLTMFSSLLRTEQPTKVAVAFDEGRKTFRSELFPEYKAQRKPTPQEFKGQVEIIRDFLETMGVTTLSNPYYEADDILATLATAAPADYEVLIVTGDRDYFQLVDEKVTVLYPVRGVSQLHRFTPAEVEKKYGLSPTQYPDYAALRGDPSDNLPSVPGVGEKTAMRWIVQYENLANLLDKAGEIKGKVGENLRERIAQVKLNRELTQMVLDVELPVQPEELDLQVADIAALNQQLEKWEFGNNLRSRILNILKLDKSNEAAAVLTESLQAEVIAEITVEESGLVWLNEEHSVLGLAFDAATQKMAIVNGEHHGILLDLAELSGVEATQLAKWLSAPEKYKCVHGAKEISAQLAAEGYSLNGIAHDTLLASYLLRPDQRRYELADLYRRYLERGLVAQEDEDSDSAVVPLEKQAAAVIELAAELAKRLLEAEAYELYQELEIPLAGILQRMEAAGIAVNREVLEEQLSHFEQQVENEVAAAREIAGDPNLSLTSPQQLQKVLFDTLALPKTKKTKTGYSTAAAELEALALTNPHPFLEHLLAHREYQKLKTTLEGLIKAIASDGRIHTTFNQTATTTGRLSSTEPNLQNIPVRTPAGREIRKSFIPGPGYECLLTADYSQIEMRVMAHLSEDAGLIDAYLKGEDLHNYVGAQVFEVPIDGVTPDLRRRVKAMSYGLAYGLSAYGLAKQLNIPPGEAKSIMEAYFRRFGGVKKYLEQVVEKARADGYTATVFGRRRYLPDLNSPNRLARDNAERAALNAPIQGTAAEVIKIAMIRVDRELQKAKVKSRVLLQVHDELVVEVYPGELEQVKKIVETEMDRAISLKVPLEVSVGVGANWDEAAH
ncbi:DNA polymerase I [Corynebacterium caspium]|uniref:DNA polymerase I n=1 Tax=Corynebacterium caspium TaxID=234828 RepID=UPI0003AA2D02